MANSPTPTQGATDSEVVQDAQNELRRRARRRLIGAGALVLLAVVVLPMVMDHDPRPPAQDIQVRIPSQDGGGVAAGFAARVLPSKAPTPLPPVVEARPPQAATPAEAPVPAKVQPRPEARTESKPEAKAEKVEAKPAPARAEPKTPAPAAVKAAADKPAAHSQPDEARAAAALSGAPVPAAAGGEQWVVQLGAYKDAANVKLLTSKLKGMGVPSYTEKYDSPQGPRTRVRAGPFATKEAAEKAQARARAIGVNGPVAVK